MLYYDGYCHEMPRMKDYSKSNCKGLKHKMILNKKREIKKELVLIRVYYKRASNIGIGAVR